MSDFLDKELLKINEGLAREDAVKKETDSLMMNKIKKYEDEISRLKDDRSRLAEENSNILTISSDHKRINEDLQVKLTAAEKKIKDFEENYIKIDGKK